MVLDEAARKRFLTAGIPPDIVQSVLDGYDAAYG